MTTDIYPSMRYHDALAAIDWLERAFGLERHLVYEGAGGRVDHAELRYGDGLIMLGTVRGDDDPRLPGQGWAYVVVGDIHAHHERANAAGAEIVEAPQVLDYGSFYSARDLEGNLWSFGTYRPAPPTRSPASGD
jgi:uncharacterized glyoxalase superfamily protein PhnB